MASKELVAMSSTTANNLLKLKNQRPTELTNSGVAIGGPTVDNPEAPLTPASSLTHDTSIPVQVPAQPKKKISEKDKELDEADKSVVDEAEKDEDELDIKDLKDDVNFLSLNLGKLIEAKMPVKKDGGDIVHVDIASHTDDDKEDNKKEKKDVAEGEMPFGKDKEEKDELKETDDSDEDDKKKEKVEESLRLRIDFTEGSKLFEGSTTLSEDEKAQAKSLFESAVRTVAQSLATQIQEAYQTYFNRIVEEKETEFAQKVESHLNYVVEQWHKDNSLVLENKYRTQFNESFIGKLKDLFEEHYVDIPAGKESFIDSILSEKKELEEQLSLSEARNVELHSATKEDLNRAQLALVKEHKARLIAEASVPLVASTRGKFATRALTLEFKNTKSFKQDLIALREQYEVADTTLVERKLDMPNASPSFETVETKEDTIEQMYGKALDALAQAK